MSEETLQPPEFLSPSSLSTYQQCPAKFKFTRIDGLEDPPGIEALCGSFVHEILETLYSRPADKRTVADARAIAGELWPNWLAKASHLLKSPKAEKEFRWMAWWAVENLYRLENPAEVNQDGIETYVEGYIEGVKVRGYIDRWAYSQEGIVIGDYKTGKTPKPQYRSDKFKQLSIYALLLEEMVGKPVHQLELIYLKYGDRLTQPVDSELTDETTKFVTTTAMSIQESCDAKDFPTKPSILCDWCSFKNTICPYWNETNQ